MKEGTKLLNAVPVSLFIIYVYTNNYLFKTQNNMYELIYMPTPFYNVFRIQTQSTS